MNLLQQPNGRWAIGGEELTSGDCVQLLAEQGWHAQRSIRAWLHGRIEHGKEGYYFLWTDEKGGKGMAINLHDGMQMRRAGDDSA